MWPMDWMWISLSIMQNWSAKVNLTARRFSYDWIFLYDRNNMLTNDSRTQNWIMNDNCNRYRYKRLKPTHIKACFNSWWIGSFIESARQKARLLDYEDLALGFHSVYVIKWRDKIWSSRLKATLVEVGPAFELILFT